MEKPEQSKKRKRSTTKTTTTTTTTNAGTNDEAGSGFLERSKISDEVEKMDKLLEKLPEKPRKHLASSVHQERIERARKEIDVSLEEAEKKEDDFVVGLWGENGGGKSFVLNCLSLLSRLEQGDRFGLTCEDIRLRGPVASAEGLPAVSGIPVMFAYSPDEPHQLRVELNFAQSSDSEQEVIANDDDDDNVLRTDDVAQARAFVKDASSTRAESVTYHSPFLNPSLLGGAKLCDLPGVTTEKQEAVLKRTFDFAVNKTEGLLIFGGQRGMSAALVAQLGALLNVMLERRKLNRLPIITVVINHAHRDPQTWLERYAQRSEPTAVSSAQGKRQKAASNSKSVMAELEEEVRKDFCEAIDQVAKDVSQYCSGIKGQRRATIFGQLKRNFLTVLFYAPEQERELLRQHNIDYNSFEAIRSVIVEMKKRFVHGLLEPVTYNLSRIGNLYLNFISAFNRWNKLSIPESNAMQARNTGQQFVHSAAGLIDAWWGEEDSPEDYLLESFSNQLNSDEDVNMVAALSIEVQRLQDDFVQYAINTMKTNALRAALAVSHILTAVDPLSKEKLKWNDAREAEIREFEQRLNTEQSEGQRTPQENLFRDMGLSILRTAEELGSLTPKSWKRLCSIRAKKCDMQNAKAITDLVRDIFQAGSTKRGKGSNKESLYDRWSDLHVIWQDLCKEKEPGEAEDLNTIRQQLYKKRVRVETNRSAESLLLDMAGHPQLLSLQPVQFKHSYPASTPVDKRLQRNIKISQTKSLKLLSTQERSSPGPYLMIEPMREEIISPDELAQLNEQKVIRISFTSNGKPWREPTLTFKAYSEWKDDLERLLSKSDHNMIWPIMIPSKLSCVRADKVVVQQRYKNRQARLVLHGATEDVRSSTLDLEDCPHLVYAFVEEEELPMYVAEYESSRENLIFVSIPGKNRGIRFARSVIKHLQDFLRASVTLPFDYWWMIDDDLVEVRMYDTQGVVTAMSRCKLSLALLFAQRALKQEVDLTRPRIVSIGDVLDRWLTRSGSRDMFYLASRNDAEWLQACTSIGAVERHLLSVLDKPHEQILGDSDEERQANRDQLAAELVNWRSQLLEVTNVCQMAFHILNIKGQTRDYNGEVSDGDNLEGNRAHYRVSNWRNRTVLNYAPPLRMHSYARTYDMFVPQSENDRRLRAEKARSGRENFFLNEDRELIKRLTTDHLCGFQLFNFALEFGKQTNGGCFPFRTDDKPKRPYHQHEESRSIKDLGLAVVARAVESLLYRAVTSNGFVEWYIDQHFQSEREMGRITDDDVPYQYVMSAAEVFNVEIRVCDMCFNSQPGAKKRYRLNLPCGAACKGTCRLEEQESDA